MNKNLAILSPNQNAYSETFIQAHKRLPFYIKFYFGGLVPSSVEGGKYFAKLTIYERFQRKLQAKFNLNEFALVQQLKKDKIEMVLAEYGETAAESLNVIMHLKLPLVVHFHGYDISVREVLLRNRDKYRQVFNYASSVIAVSKKMKEDLVSAGCPIEKLILNPYGPDLDFFSVKPMYSKKHFVTVGRFVDKKAPFLTILAFERVKKDFPDAALTMVGDGPLKGACQQMVNVMGLGDNVTFTGPLKRKELLSLFERSIALIQHSVTASNGDSEGTPVVILEAQAAALPVVSTFHGGIPDVIIHNETGFLVEEGDVESMSFFMGQILERNDIARKLGNNGRIRIKNHFSMEMHLEKLKVELENSVFHKHSI